MQNVRNIGCGNTARLRYIVMKFQENETVALKSF